MISAGRLRFNATVKRESALDNVGKKKKDFATTVGTFRCDLRDISANELDYGLGVAATRTYEILARWQTIEKLGVLETDILQCDGMEFQIKGIRNEANRDRLARIDVEEIR
jgi:hypothetical protein